MLKTIERSLMTFFAEERSRDVLKDVLLNIALNHPNIVYDSLKNLGLVRLDFEQMVVESLKTAGTVPTIKLIRNEKGCSLKDAKEILDNIKEKWNII